MMSVGKAQTEHHGLRVCHNGMQGLQIEDSELREYTHGMLGSIAEKLGKSFAPFLHHAVGAALASCAQASSGSAGMLHALPLPCQPRQPHARESASPESVLREAGTSIVWPITHCILIALSPSEIATYEALLCCWMMMLLKFISG